MNQRPPTLDPEQWETHGVFRETFLCLRLSEADAEAIRAVGWTGYQEALRRLQGPEETEALARRP